MMAVMEKLFFAVGKLGQLLVVVGVVVVLVVVLTRSNLAKWAWSFYRTGAMVRLRTPSRGGLPGSDPARAAEARREAAALQLAALLKLVHASLNVFVAERYFEQLEVLRGHKLDELVAAKRRELKAATRTDRV